MESTISFKKAILEYEKPGIPKLINNKYKVVSIDNPNDFMFVEKEELPSISDNFAVHVIDTEASLCNENEIEEKCNPELLLLKPEHVEIDIQDKRTTWNDEGTRLLLNLYKQTEPLIGSSQIRSKRKMWENISAEMNNAGFNYSSEQVENRFKSVIRAYRKVNQSETLLSKSQKPCFYQEELDAIFLKNTVKSAGDSVEVHYEQEDSNQDDELDDETDDLFDTINDSDIKKIDWDQKASKLLLSLYKKKKPFLEMRKFKNKKEMWENIATEINKRNYIFTGSQVENRFKTLLRGYRKVLKEGTKRKVFIYQDELDEIFLEDNDVFPEIISGSERKNLKKQILGRLGMEVDDMEEYMENNETVLQEENTSTLSILKEIRNELINAEKRAAERHSDLVRLLREANDIQRRKTDLIDKYVALQKKPCT